MKKSQFIILLLFMVTILNQSSFAQYDDLYASTEKYFEGYIVNLEGDTIEGYVNYKNYLYLRFRNLKGKKKKYTASKIKGFGDYENNRHMESFFIKHKKNTYFLERWVSGKVGLYYDYKESHKNYPSPTAVLGSWLSWKFDKAISSNWMSPFYLTKEEKLLRIPGAKKKFIITMEKHLGDDKELITKIKNEEYSIDDITIIVAFYNVSWSKSFMN